MRRTPGLAAAALRRLSAAGPGHRPGLTASSLRHLSAAGPARSTDAAATERFNRLASQWDASPSALKRVQLMGEAVRSSAWWGELGSGTTRAMDFGCGTGLLSFELMQPGAMSILGVDLAEGMIAKFNDKAAEAGLEGAMRATAVDLQATAAASDLGRFDLIFSMLAFHHVPDPAGMVRDLTKHYLKPGGRLAVLDLEATPNVGRFHGRHMELGVHYEHDGFTEAAARAWFDPADGWAADSVDVTRVPFDKKVDKTWDASEPTVKYTMMLVTAALAGSG